MIHGRPTSADVAAATERRLHLQETRGRDGQLRTQTTPTATRSHRGRSAPVSAGGGAGFGRGLPIIDAPTALQRGDTMQDLIFAGGERGGLLTAGVLGTPEHVCTGLDAALVLQHPLVRLSGGEHQRIRGGRNEFNLATPATVFHLNQNGSKLIGGGLEAGMMPMGAAAGEAGGLRPGVLDARGAEWNGGPLRELTSESPAAHAERDCPHLFVSTNWMLKKGGSWPEKMAHPIEMLVTVTTWMSMGRSCVVHCIPLLFPPPEVYCYYLF